jgi:hypothetical protein
MNWPKMQISRPLLFVAKQFFQKSLGPYILWHRNLARLRNHQHENIVAINHDWVASDLLIIFVSTTTANFCHSYDPFIDCPISMKNHVLAHITPVFRLNDFWPSFGPWIKTCFDLLMIFMLPATQNLFWTILHKQLVQFHFIFTRINSTKSCCAYRQHILVQIFFSEL